MRWRQLTHRLPLTGVAVAGAVVGHMVAYVLATFGIFRLVRRGLDFLGASPGLARLSAWTAAVFFSALIDCSGPAISFLPFERNR